jgi:hypothetical protein
MKKTLAIILLSILFVSCQKESVIESFIPIMEQKGVDTVRYDFNLQKGVFSSLTLPNDDSLFHFSLKLKPNKENKKYYYKIYYQNVSYAFDDDNPLSYENFYGSWENTSTTFKPINSLSVEDSFRIVGNPRNEKQYYGKPFPRQYTDKDIKEGIEVIKRDKKWYNSIIKKAKDNKVTVDEQMYRDLLWTMEMDRNGSGEENRRERRNPRCGVYEFMIVVVDSETLNKIPAYIKDISKTNEDKQFVNPFDYFINEEGSKMKGVSVMVSNQKLKARAKFNLNNRVYINRATYPFSDFKVYPNNPKVGNSDSLYYYAQFEQYYHNIDNNRFIYQIPVIGDVENNEYTLSDYLKNKKLYTNSHSLIPIHPTITSYPGKTIRVKNNEIDLFNPKSEDISSARKESVGIRTRIGFTYGKFICKIKFPKLLNKSGLWNGITNAFWLIYQSDNDWNARRECKTGYVKQSANERETQRTNKTNYSEIDIEMIKTSKYWPYQEVNKKEKYNPINNNFIFASTNWDLACDDNNHIKRHLLFDYKHQDKTFTLHRWFDTYRALTSKVEVSNDIFLQPYYYYEIEWKPNEIIWRIGKDLNNMYEVGYMNESFTSIPNNQMLAIITQEYHYAQFWLPMVFMQDFIPFNKQDIVGKIYELTVE